ncbi:MAG: nitronate monooxygenase [Burkholderiaceae bacterium]|nr:nitronate monooxygenase [Burkholderiaceae bacterium]
MRPPVFRTRITELFGIRHPILCGGLQWLADARYVAAAVNAGAMGFVTALSFPDDAQAFRRELRRCAELTGGSPFGASVAISRRAGANERLAAYVDVIVEEKVRFVETSGDSPQPWLGRLKDAGCVVIHKVPTVRHALSAQKLEVDAITVIAAEAGGHPGTRMVPQVIQSALAAEVVTKPFALGGGMSTGRHLVGAIAMGVDAILVGSRMVVAEEIWAHRRYKEHVVGIDETANRVVMKRFRNHHRVLDNDTSRDVEALEAEGIDDFDRYAGHVSGRLARRAYETGDWSTGMIDMGPSGVFAREIKPVEAIIDEIVDDAIRAASRVDLARVPS